MNRFTWKEIHMQQGLRVRKVTIAQIAAAAQVSKSTVSLILNGKENAVPLSEATRERVLDTARQLGYRPNAAAKALATGRSQTVLVVAFGSWDENLLERLRGAESWLVPARYSTRMCTVSDDIGLQGCLEVVQTGLADGILVTGTVTARELPAYQRLNADAGAMGMPVVALADAFPPGVVANVAQIDDAGGAAMAMAHLVGHGHRRIVLLGVAGLRWAQQREQGYRMALDRAGIPDDPSLIALGDGSQSWAYNAMLTLAATVDFSAVFAMNDYLAIAALAALKMVGRRVPEDCALIGFDDNEKFARYTDPPLTTIANPLFETSRTAANRLLDMIDGAPFRPVSLPVEMVIRQSCGCLNA